MAADLGSLHGMAQRQTLPQAAPTSVKQYRQGCHPAPARFATWSTPANLSLGRQKSGRFQTEACLASEQGWTTSLNSTLSPAGPYCPWPRADRQDPLDFPFVPRRSTDKVWGQPTTAHGLWTTLVSYLFLQGRPEVCTSTPPLPTPHPTGPCPELPSSCPPAWSLCLSSVSRFRILIRSFKYLALLMMDEYHLLHSPQGPSI